MTGKNDLVTPTEIAVSATIDRLAALETAEECQQVRHLAWAEMAAAGHTHRGISELMREGLVRAGKDETQIKAAGIGHYNIGLGIAMVQRRP